MSRSEQLLKSIEESLPALGMSLDDFLSEKEEEVRGRVFLLCHPNTVAPESRLESYLTRVLGREPHAEELANAYRRSRRFRPSEDQLILLERDQNSRCPLCGTFLDSEARPHLDHIVPLALGGADDVANMQILCHKCNRGKSNLPVWEVGAPYMTRKLTDRVRYCALARARGRCQESTCTTTSLISFLEPKLRIPSSLGGAWILDNLEVLCEDHVRERNGERRKTPSTRRRRGSRGTR